jgi:hypothetical protein
MDNTASVCVGKPVANLLEVIQRLSKAGRALRKPRHNYPNLSDP